jgi:hypothetical protein
MKQAKAEADAEIGSYRKEQDNAFHLGSSEVRSPFLCAFFTSA